MFQHILVLWDGSEIAERAFEVATDLGAVYNAQITAVCVVQPPQRQRHSWLISPRHDRGHHHGNAWPRGDEVQALFTDRHIENHPPPCECQFQLIHGYDVVNDVLALAHEHGSDLVVIGHHHAHAPHHIFPHGLTERLMFSGQVPVLVVGE